MLVHLEIFKSIYWTWRSERYSVIIYILVSFLHNLHPNVSFRSAQIAGAIVFLVNPYYQVLNDIIANH